MEIETTKEIQVAKQETEVAQNEANSIIILNDEDCARAIKIGMRTKELQKNLETQRKFFVSPLNDQVKNINDLFKKFSAPLLETEGILKTKILAYRSEQEKIRAEAQAKIDAEAKKVQQQLNRQAKKDGTEAPQVVVPQVEQALPKQAGASVVKRWTFKVTNLGVVPRDLMVLDETKVRSMIREGVREIRGIEIYQEENLSLRS